MEPENKLKLSPEDGMVQLAKWHELVESTIYKDTVEAEVLRQLKVLNRQLADIVEQPATLNLAVRTTVLTRTKATLEELLETFARKSRKYQTKLKGEPQHE